MYSSTMWSTPSKPADVPKRAMCMCIALINHVDIFCPTLATAPLARANRDVDQRYGTWVTYRVAKVVSPSFAHCSAVGLYGSPTDTAAMYLLAMWRL